MNPGTLFEETPCVNHKKKLVQRTQIFTLIIKMKNDDVCGRSCAGVMMTHKGSHTLTLFIMLIVILIMGGG